MIPAASAIGFVKCSLNPVHRIIGISGLTFRRDDDSDSGVPGAKDIPLLGWMFKTQGSYNTSREILIFITPAVLAEWKPGETQKTLQDIEGEMKRQDVQGDDI